MMVLWWRCLDECGATGCSCVLRCSLDFIHHGKVVWARRCQWVARRKDHEPQEHEGSDQHCFIRTILPEADEDMGATQHLLGILKKSHKGLLAALGELSHPQVQSPPSHSRLPHHRRLLRKLELEAQTHATTFGCSNHFSTRHRLGASAGHRGL